MTDATTQPIATKTRLLYALLYSAGRFVPVPLVDDLLREEVALRMVVQATEAAGQPVPRSHLSPLAAPATGCLRGCLGLVPKLLLSIVLFPIKKIANVILGVRHFTRDVTEIVLLGRLVDRALARGDVDPKKSEEAQRVDALQLRMALDRALSNTDLDILGTTLRAAFGPIRGVMLSGVSALRVLWRGSETAPTPTSAPLTESTSRLERAFDRPEVRALIEGFDAKIDAALAEVRQGR